MKKTKLTDKKLSTGAIPLQTPDDSVYAMMGYNQFPYKEKTIEEYRSSLDAMNLADLQRHAVQHSIVPNTLTRSILVDRLEREYLKKRYAYVDVKDVSPTEAVSKKKELEIQDLLSRGR